jgi:ABC-type phosphonate transport system ATPase subunit
MNEQVIKINNLTKHYGKHRGIEDITFSVATGGLRRSLSQRGCTSHRISVDPYPLGGAR